MTADDFEPRSDAEMIEQGWTKTSGAWVPPGPASRMGNGSLTTPSLIDAISPSDPEDIPDLAREQDILAAFLKAARSAGVVGEDVIVQTEYLGITSRVLDKPVSLVVKGASSSGKSYATEATIKFFPKKALVVFTGLSEKALLLSKRSYEHRTIVIFEATALRERAERQSGDQTAYYIRSLVSEGRTSYEMSVRDKEGGWTTRTFEKSGPTNLIITTTALALHNENETRMLSLSTNDSAEQTRRVLRELAADAAGAVDVRPWHELQEWIWRQDNRVHIPYAKALADRIPDPALAVRLRRDFGAVLSLIKAHAVLHQANRTRDEQGRILATVQDYGAVRDLILDVVSQGVGASVSTGIREVVALLPAQGGLSAAEVGRRLNVDPSWSRRRLQAAVVAGFAVNQEDRPRRPGMYVVGQPLPHDVVILPRPADLVPTHQPDESETAGQAHDGEMASSSQGVLRDAVALVQAELDAVIPPDPEPLATPRDAWEAEQAFGNSGAALLSAYRDRFGSVPRDIAGVVPARHLRELVETRARPRVVSGPEDVQGQLGGEAS